jgi:serine/threonine-protein kinase
MVWRLPDYEHVDNLGSGSTGEVVSARDQATDTVVAVKYLADAVYDAPGFAERFREVTAKLADVEDPHLAQVYEFVEGTDSAAVITELVDGVSVRRLLESGPLDPESALFVIKSTLAGLAELHRVSVVHRDIRPENLLVTPDGTVKVVDTGIAPPIQHDGEIPRYLAPEVWAGESVTFASDVYATAATLFECLTGDESAAIQSVDLPPRVRKIVTRNLAVKADDRNGDAGKMLDALALVALSSYGSHWEQTGKEKLVSRLEQAKMKPRPAVPPTRRIIPTERSKHVLIAVGLTIVLALVFVSATTGVFFPGTRAVADTNDIGSITLVQHVPIAQSGPPVPVPASPGPTTDKVKPSRPTGLDVTGRSVTAMTLDWNPAHDNRKVTGYIVQRGGKRVATTYTPGYTDYGLSPQTAYSYTVVAFDAAGNQSPVSTTAYGTTLTKPDTTHPSAPSHLHSTSHSQTTIVLVWTGSHDDIGVAGYDVFRDGTRIASVSRPHFTDTHLKQLVPQQQHDLGVDDRDTGHHGADDAHDHERDRYQFQHHRHQLDRVERRERRRGLRGVPRRRQGRRCHGHRLRRRWAERQQHPLVHGSGSRRVRQPVGPQREPVGHDAGRPGDASDRHADGSADHHADDRAADGSADRHADDRAAHARPAGHDGPAADTGPAGHQRPAAGSVGRSVGGRRGPADAEPARARPGRPGTDAHHPGFERGVLRLTTPGYS